MVNMVDVLALTLLKLDRAVVACVLLAFEQVLYLYRGIGSWDSFFAGTMVLIIDITLLSVSHPILALILMPLLCMFSVIPYTCSLVDQSILRVFSTLAIILSSFFCFVAKTITGFALRSQAVPPVLLWTKVIRRGGKIFLTLGAPLITLGNIVRPVVVCFTARIIICNRAFPAPGAQAGRVLFLQSEKILESNGEFLLALCAASKWYTVHAVETNPFYRHASGCSCTAGAHIIFGELIIAQIGLPSKFRRLTAIGLLGKQIEQLAAQPIS